MYINLSALVRQMYSGMISSSEHTDLSTMADDELLGYILLAGSLKDLIIALDNIRDVYVEVVGDEPYVKHSLFDIP